MDLKMFNSSGGKELLEAKIEERFGKSVPMEFIFNDTGRPYEDSFIDLVKLIQMDIDFEEN